MENIHVLTFTDDVNTLADTSSLLQINIKTFEQFTIGTGTKINFDETNVRNGAPLW